MVFTMPLFFVQIRIPGVAESSFLVAKEIDFAVSRKADDGRSSCAQTPSVKSLSAFDSSLREGAYIVPRITQPSPRTGRVKNAYLSFTFS